MSLSDNACCDCNILDPTNGFTAPHYAVLANCNSVAILEILKSEGCKMSVKATNGMNPYELADRISNIEASDYLKGIKSGRGWDEEIAGFMQQFRELGNDVFNDFEEMLGLKEKTSDNPS